MLQILTGPETGRKIYLKTGQMASFGRTEWSDFAFSYDNSLADVHFSIETNDDTVTLIDNSDGRGVVVDGQQITKCSLGSGQKIKAGNLVFAVTTELLFETSGSGPVAVAQKQTGVTIPAELAIRVCENLDLSDTATELLDKSTEVLPFIDQLSSENLLLDALRVLAASLSKRKALWWAANCVESACADRLQAQERLISLSRAWVLEPTEENCHNALHAAETTDSELPACWLGHATSWSGESLAPPGLPSVPPAKHLNIQGIMAALLLAAVFINPAKSTENYRSFIELGKQISKTTLDWESNIA